MSERSWTVDEANAALPRITAAIERVRSAASAARASSGDEEQRVASNGHRGTSPATEELNAAIEELGRDGVVVRDIERGLVDFPAVSTSGRRYWLCWVVGEPSVDWWHWPEDGFAGRTPITDPPT